jgi:hypothetical protein
MRPERPIYWSQALSRSVTFSTTQSLSKNFTPSGFGIIYSYEARSRSGQNHQGIPGFSMSRVFRLGSGAGWVVAGRAPIAGAPSSNRFL